MEPFHIGQRYAAALLSGCLWACSTGPELDLTLHESDQGKVYLERMSNRSFQAAHPIKLSPDTVSRVLRGVIVKSPQGFLRTFAGGTDTAPAFTEDDIAFLAPLITDGLSRAAPDQQVGFTVRQLGAADYSDKFGAAVGSSEPALRLAPPESTGGSLYAYGRSLYVTLTQYRHRTERPDTINLANRRIPDESGLINHTVLFVPESAKRPDSYRDSQSTDNTLVIDYELLARLPTDLAPSPPTQPRPAAESSPTVQSTTQSGPAKKDPEVEALRKELEEIKRQLAEQESQRNLGQPKKPAAPKTP
ncbi:MAG TPA: hypothetical protein VIU63_06915 [Nitrospira sp.]